MIVYVETNFVLEIVYLQEEHRSCDELLALAETGDIALAIPAFSITEASMNRVRLVKRRKEFQGRLLNELHELSRLKPYTDISSQSEPLTRALIESIEEHYRRLTSVIARILAVAQVIPLHDSTVQLAIDKESILGLEPADAAVYASILEDLSHDGEAKLFLNRNSKDFSIPDIEAELSTYQCRMIPSFVHGLSYINSTKTGSG